jgi:hypothetical protein
VFLGSKLEQIITLFFDDYRLALLLIFGFGRGGGGNRGSRRRRRRRGDRLQADGDDGAAAVLVVGVGVEKEPPIPSLLQEDSHHGPEDGLDEEHGTVVPRPDGSRPEVPAGPGDGLVEGEDDRGEDGDGVRVADQPLVHQRHGHRCVDVCPQRGAARAAVGPDQDGSLPEPDGPDVVATRSHGGQVGFVKVHQERRRTQVVHDVGAVRTRQRECDAVGAVADGGRLLDDRVGGGRHVQVEFHCPAQALEPPRPGGRPRRGEDLCQDRVHQQRGRRRRRRRLRRRIRRGEERGGAAAAAVAATVTDVFRHLVCFLVACS